MLLEVVALTIISSLTSAISAAFGLAGGVAMLIALLLLTSFIIALPAHELVQIGFNASRTYMIRSSVLARLLVWFVPYRLTARLGALVVFSFSSIFTN